MTMGPICAEPARNSAESAYGPVLCIRTDDRAARHAVSVRGKDQRHIGRAGYGSRQSSTAFPFTRSAVSSQYESDLNYAELIWRKTNEKRLVP